MNTGTHRGSILSIFFLVSIVLIGACEIITRSSSTQQLVIEEATVEKNDTTSSDEVTYNLNFTYYVTNEACEVGGFSISFNERSMVVNWYDKKLLKPDKRYNISHRFTAEPDLETVLTLRMTGYLINSSDSNKELKEEKIIPVQ